MKIYRKIRIKPVKVLWSLVDRRGSFLVWQFIRGDIRVVVEFIHNEGRELISETG